LKLSNHFFLISSSESCAGFFELEVGVDAAFSVLFSVCAESFETGAGAAAGEVALGVVGFEDLEEEIVFFSSDFFGCELDLVGVTGAPAGSAGGF
jgi:hypothetical protein